MEIQTNGAASPFAVSSTTSSTSSNDRSPNPIITTTTTNPPKNPNPNPNNHTANPMQSWWESISRARSRIHSLSSIVPSGSDSISPLADSDCPARSLLDSPSAGSAVSSALRLPSSGSGDDPLCQWIYETHLSPDADLRLVVLSFAPLIAGLYLSRVVSSSPSLAGFESVLLAFYNAEARSRSGKPVLVSVPDLSCPSLYHSPPPRQPLPSSKSSQPNQPRPLSVGVFSPPLEPQIGVKSTKRACVVAVALDCFYKKISLMPARSKLDLCEFASAWSGQNCPCRTDLDKADDDEGIGFVSEEFSKLRVCREGSGSRIPFPWELMQPVLRILGHCLLAPLNTQEVRDAASASVRCVYARASHDLVPQAILAARSLIQLDRRARSAAAAVVAASANVSSNPNTPSKQRKPEVFLASK
ncbi:hypothetical protein QJS04_geneDACA023217 [Acorus gramineus]|uniref:Hyccin n=1 Tax=Acorus gramineus TaxID=55184 RepID=A0AAV9AP06_ACOGR|nr:hypothetical protein QJS04_geneDACA023217 [Acorus gramineus]